MIIQNGANALTGSACLEKPERAFRNAMQGVFGPLDWLPSPDGTLHRFRVPGDKCGTLNGWYVLHLDGFPFGIFGSWKDGFWHSWSSRKPLSPIERALALQRIQRANEKRASDRARGQLATAQYAARVWSQARLADADHPYLARKQVPGHRLRQCGSMLLVPLYTDGYLYNLQRIDADGKKRFLSGGRIKGTYSPIGTLEPEQPLYVCEGWATGATIHCETGAAVACAMSAGNLLDVGLQLQRLYPSNRLIIAGDDDRQTAGNPGRTAADRAAAALGCGVVMPQWTGTEPLELSDFNDLARWRSVCK